MRVVIWLWGALFLLAGQAAVEGCGGSDDGPLAKTCVEGDACECIDRASCNLQCDDLVGCEPICRNFGSSCTTACTDDCEVRCQGGDRVDGFCDSLCGANCNARCSSVGSCLFETGPNGTVACTNATSCNAELGEGSTATCLGVTGTCFVRCFGTCEVVCADAGSCNVICVNEDRNQCGQGFFACGECPMTEP